jgi:ABC-type glycerol-3-phosphate transport system substrate-binding protein
LDLTLDDTALANSVARLAMTLADEQQPTQAHLQGSIIKIDDREVYQVAMPVRAVTSDTIQAALVQSGIVRSGQLGSCFAPLVAGAAAPQVDARGELNVWMQEDAASPAYAYLANLAGAFMAANPGVEINLIPKDAQTVRETFPDEGEEVDLLWTTNEEIQVFAASDLLRALNFLTPNLYAEPAIAGGTRDGSIYGAPVHTGNNLVLYYNKKLLREPPRDTDALIRLGATLTKEPIGQYALVYDTTNPFWLMPWLGAFNSSVVDADGQTPTLNTRAMTETLTLLKTFKDKKVVSPDADNIIADAIFSEGRAAMIINGDEALPAYAARFGSDLGVTRLPQVAKNELPRPYTGGVYFALPAGVSGDKLEIAQAFIRFVTSKPIQLDMAKKFRRLPALNDALRDPTLVNDAILKGLNDQMQLGIAPPDSTILTCIWEAIHPNQLGVLNASTPPADAARAMQSSAEACINNLP